MSTASAASLPYPGCTGRLRLVTSDVGLWRSIAAALRKGISDGRYPVGSRLPSIRRAREEFDAAAGTVQTALDQLVTEGLVEKRHGSGHWVIRREPAADLAQRVASLEERVARLEEERVARPDTAEGA